MRRVMAMGAAAAALLAGVGVASAKGWYGPGYMTNTLHAGLGDVADLAVSGYKDGHPFYCTDQAKLHLSGDENKGAWTTSTDVNDRIAAQMVREHETDQSDLTQASVAYAIHDHLDAERDKFLAAMAGGLKGGDINQVRRLATQYWNAAASHTPSVVRTRLVKGNLAHGTVTIDLRDQNNHPVPGVPWRIDVTDGADKVKFDGPTSGTSSSAPVTVGWHAVAKGSFHWRIVYKSAVARRMAAASGNMQPLFTSGRDVQEFPSGIQFSGEITPLYRLGVKTRQKAGKVRVGDKTPVRDTLTVKMDPSSPDAQFDPVSDKTTVTLHFDGHEYVPAAQASKVMMITGAGSVDSPSFTPADLGWGGPARHGWQAGNYWFDIQVPKQGQMSEAVDTPDRQPAESFTLAAVPPKKPFKRIEEGHAASNMPDRTIVSTKTGRGGYHMTFVDTFTNPDNLSYKVTGMKVTDATAGMDVSDRFNFSDGSNSPARVTATYKGSDELPVDHEYRFSLDVTVTKPCEGDSLKDKATVLWNKTGGDTDEHHFDTHEPKPDKAWVLDKNGALTTDDPKWSNKVGADNKTFLPGDPVSAVANGRVPSDLVHDLASYEITDDWSDAAKYVDFSDPSKVAVYYDGRDVTDQFTIRVDGTKTIATAKPAFLKGTAHLSKDRPVKLILTGAFRTDYLTGGRTERLTNLASEQWNDHKKPTNIPAVFTWTPNPDKAWIRNSKPDGTGKWEVAIDPDKTNAVGGDAKTYRDGDPVGLVVNGTVPTGLAVKPTIVLSDDYGKADYVWDPAEQSQWRVYEADVDDYSKSTVADIVNTGRDVTGAFTFTHNGTKITATPTDAYAKSLMNLAKGRQIVLLVPGKINLADGKGNQQVYEDTKYEDNSSWTITREETDKDGAHGYQVCVNPTGSKSASASKHEGEKFLNTGSQTAGKVTVPTNQPPICVWVPNVVKSVTAAQEQGGDEHNGESQLVRPGQQIRYNLHLLDTVRTADEAGYQVVKAAVDDTYDPMVSLDSDEIIVQNNRASGKQLAIGRDYTVSVDQKAHTFHLEFTQSYISSHWAPGDTIDITVRFLARVSEKIAPAYVVKNHFVYTVNNGASISNEVQNTYVPPKPKKEDTQHDKPSININGKKAVLGDILDYRLTLSAKDLKYNLGDITDPKQSEGKQMYMVQRLGMVDDYDDEYLDLDAKNIKVLDASGKDATAKFNTSVKDGIAYVFAKTVDTKIGPNGHIVRGDPQPTSLKEYSERQLDKLNAPYIDQTLLGQDYTIVLPVKVRKVTDGYDVKNTATQIVDDQKYVTNQVHNPLVVINPSKDIVVNVGDASVNGKDIYKGHYFLYRLDSSKRPKDLAYPQVTDWRIVDKLDPVYDKYTGQWAVYANADLYSTDGQLLARKGEKIAGSGLDSSKFKQGGILTGTDSQLFTAAQTTDGTLTVAATDSYKRLVSDGNHEAAWTAYIQCQRLKPVEKHENRFDEYINGTKRPSNIVWTRTPDQTPSMRIEKYDLASGLQTGDRNKPAEALDNVKDGTRIGLLITNTGKSDLHRFDMTDRTIAGTGDVTWDQKDVDTLKNTTLKPGESFTVHGTLNGVKGFHTDRAKVTSTPILPCPTEQTPDIDKPQDGTQVKYCDSTPIKEQDDWNGRLTPLAATGTAVRVVIAAAIALLLCALALMALAAGRRVDRSRRRAHPAHKA